jgi:hypothetical protein
LIQSVEVLETKFDNDGAGIRCIRFVKLTTWRPKCSFDPNLRSWTGHGVNRYTDRLTICCVPRSIVYEANVRCVLPTLSDPAYHIYFATDTQGTKVQHDYAIMAKGDSACLVTDNVTLSAPWVLRGYVRRTASAAHTAMMDRLPAAVLEYTPAS